MFFKSLKVTIIQVSSLQPWTTGLRREGNSLDLEITLIYRTKEGRQFFGFGDHSDISDKGGMASQCYEATLDYWTREGWQVPVFEAILDYWTREGWQVPGF